MKELYKDIIILFFFASANSLYFLWSLVFPYLTSYLKHFDSSITLNKIFTTTPGCFLGIIIGNYILPKCFYFFGIKKTMIIGSFLYLFNSLSFFYFKGIIWAFINMIGMGIVYQFNINSLNYFLSSKYENGVIYSSYSYIGQNLTTIIWSFLITKIINPFNKKMEGLTFENGIKENFFEWDVIQNFPKFLIYNGFISFLIMLTSIFFLKEPVYTKEKVEKYYYESKSEYDSNLSIILEENEDEKSLSDIDAEKKSKKIIFDKDFLLLIILMAFRNGSLLYFVEVYKITGNIIINDDQITSNALSISCIFNIFGKIFSPFLWKKLNFYWFNNLCFLLNIVNLIIYLFLAIDNSYIMYGLASFSRILLGIFYMISYYTIFGIFKPKIAIHLSKVFDSNYLIGLIISTWLNYLFFNQSDIVTVFVIHLIFNIISFFIFFRKFKNFEKKSGKI